MKPTACISTGFSQFPCAFVQMQYSVRENGCGHILKGGPSSGKGVKEKGKVEKGGKEQLEPRIMIIIK